MCHYDWVAQFWTHSAAFKILVTWYPGSCIGSHLHVINKNRFLSVVSLSVIFLGHCRSLWQLLLILILVVSVKNVTRTPQVCYSVQWVEMLYVHFAGNGTIPTPSFDSILQNLASHALESMAALDSNNKPLGAKNNSQQGAADDEIECIEEVSSLMSKRRKERMSRNKKG